MTGRWFPNNDIPINILSRLYAKTLNHVKYVSKEWLSLVTDRSFIRLQLKKTEPVSGFFFQELYQWTIVDDIERISYVPVGTDEVKVWQNVIDFLPESAVTLSSNNGLLCLRSCFPNSDPKIYVCNPLNKQWLRIEWPNISRYSSVAIAFDPFRNPVDASTDFELVALSDVDAARYEYLYSFDIYSSKTGLWRRSKESRLCNYNLDKNKGVYVEGILYWLTDGYQILVFDLENELSSLIVTPIPEIQFSSFPEMCIGESKGNLYCVIISEDGLQLWILEDRFESEWGLKVSIPLNDLERDHPDVLRDISENVLSRLSRDQNPWIDPLAFKDEILFLRVASEFYEYCFDGGNKMKRLCDVSTLGHRSMFAPIVVPYTMSLVPLG